MFDVDDISDSYKIQELLNNFPGMVSFANLDSNFLSLNQEAINKYGFKNLEQGFMQPYDSIDCPAAEFANIFRKQDNMVKNQQQEQQSIGTKLLHNDRFTILSTTKKLVRNKSGQTLGVLTICQDMTDNPFFNQHLLFSHQHLERCAGINGMQVTYIIEGYGDNKNNLSKRQAECLFLLCHGLSAKAIAAVLSLSKRTVEAYIDDLKNKLNCQSKSDLISHCMTLGIQNIIPSDILFNKLLNKQFADELY